MLVEVRETLKDKHPEPNGKLYIVRGASLVMQLDHILLTARKVLGNPRYEDFDVRNDMSSFTLRHLESRTLVPTNEILAWSTSC